MAHTVRVLAATVAVVASACAAPPKQTTVHVVAREYAFEPATLTVPAGDVRFDIRNGGAEIHELMVWRGDDIVGHAERIAPGAASALDVKLEAGRYRYVCKRPPGHDGLGMKGSLTVE